MGTFEYFSPFLAIVHTHVIWHIYKLQNSDHHSVSYHIHSVMWLLFLFCDEHMNISLNKNDDNDNVQYYVESSYPSLLYWWSYGARRWCVANNTNPNSYCLLTLTDSFSAWAVLPWQRIPICFVTITFDEDYHSRCKII